MEDLEGLELEFGKFEFGSLDVYNDHIMSDWSWADEGIIITSSTLCRTILLILDDTPVNPKVFFYESDLAYKIKKVINLGQQIMANILHRKAINPRF